GKSNERARFRKHERSSALRPPTKGPNARGACTFGRSRVGSDPRGRRLAQGEKRSLAGRRADVPRLRPVVIHSASAQRDLKPFSALAALAVDKVKRGLRRHECTVVTELWLRGGDSVR